MRRRTLTYNVSLLLVLLRKRLVEFETSGGEGRLVLTTEQIVEMLRLFQAESTNDARDRRPGRDDDQEGRRAGLPAAVARPDATTGRSAES